MRFEQRITLPGSERPPAPDSREVSPVPGSQLIEVTVVLRRRTELQVPALGTMEARATSRDFIELYGADPKDIAHVESFAHHSGLTVVEASIPKRRLILAGTADAFSAAFGATIACYETDEGGRLFRGRTGPLTIPVELEGVVIAVLGIDTRPAARAHFRAISPKAAVGSFTPPQVAGLYNFPAGLDGTGQTVAIIELGGGYNVADLQTYFSNLGVKEPSITAVSVDGGANAPGGEADGEVMLDIEVIGSIAPGAKIAVYFAPNTDQGFVDAITDAVHDSARKPSVISISWGGPEDSWTAQSRTALDAALQDAAALGVTVTAAAGDSGSSDGNTDGKLHVDFPSSSGYALACGGTRLSGTGTSITSEVVWNETAQGEGATGGGISTVFPLPSYQSSSNVPAQPQTNFAGRGVPDVAGNADPTTGYQIRVGGQDQVIGGTSAVAPLWAALVALMNQSLGTPLGYLQPKIYPLGEAAFQDITNGNNDDSGLGQYNARAGWDACTGLGSPNGTALLNALSSARASAAGS